MYYALFFLGTSKYFEYRRGTDVLAILLKSDPSFYVIGRFCNNKK